ncbi:MAG: hypothetical protein ACK4YO_03605, partial [Candidatus Altarchaeaceae archaeon]
ILIKYNNTIGNLRVLFASYAKVPNDTVIAKLKVKINASALHNYLNTSLCNSTSTDPACISPLNLIIEKMGANRTNFVVNSSTDANALNIIKNGLIKACRGDANNNSMIDNGDKMAIIRATLSGTPYYYNLSEIIS